MKTPILQIEHVSKIYELEGVTVTALDDINIDIKENEFISIIGPSGSGKSTLMHIIGALDTPSLGKVIINGEDVSKLNETQLARIRNHNIGFVFQQFNLLAKTSALDNAILPLIYAGMNSKEERVNKGVKILQKVGLGDRLHNNPNQLSGGQQQRVAIARALINNPSIILADEPTGNLDSKTGVEIMNIFRQLHKEGNTIIIVTHALEVAQQAKRIIRIKDGKIVDKL